jgi:hypothetical protein
MLKKLGLRGNTGRGAVVKERVNLDQDFFQRVKLALTCNPKS